MGFSLVSSFGFSGNSSLFTSSGDSVGVSCSTSSTFFPFFLPPNYYFKQKRACTRTSCEELQAHLQLQSFSILGYIKYSTHIYYCQAKARQKEVPCLLCEETQITQK